MNVEQLAPGILYFPHFVSEPDAALAEVVEQVAFVQRTRRLYGRSVATPRMEAWHGPAPYRFGGSDLQAAPLPPALASLAVRAEFVIMSGIRGTEARFDSCLANLYRDGGDSVGWHSDDEPEMGDPLIASVSLGAPRDFLLRRKPGFAESPAASCVRDSEAIKVRLEPGSLLVMLRGVQAEWQHALPKRPACLSPRVNLTFRDCRGAA